MAIAAPAFQFYVKEWRGSRAVQLMTFAVRGMYLEMLLEQWEKLTLPDSPAACAHLLGGTLEEWEIAWTQLRQNFVARGHGRIVNRRLERVRTDARAYREHMGRNAQHGGIKRAASASRSKNGTYLPAAIQPPPAGAPAAYQPPPASASATASASDLQSARESRSRFGGSIIGRNPHLDHAACDDTNSRCVPAAVHHKLADGLAPKHGGDREAAKAALLAWYPTVWATLAPDAVIGEAFKFWQKRFDATFANVEAPVSKRLTEDPAAMAAGVREILKQQGAL